MSSVTNSVQFCKAKIVRGIDWFEVTIFNGDSLVVGSLLGDNQSTNSPGNASGCPEGAEGVPSDAGRDTEFSYFDEKRKAENRERSIRRSKQQVRRKAKDLASANPGGQYMVTLTYADNMQDREKALKDWEMFVKRVHKSTDIQFQYVAVAEKQKRGAWHFHILTNVYLEHSEWAKLWGHGYIWVSKCNDARHAMRYICKYFRKGWSDSEELSGKNRYFCSKGFDYQTYYITEKEFKNGLRTWFKVAGLDPDCCSIEGFIELSDIEITWFEGIEWRKASSPSGRTP